MEVIDISDDSSENGAVSISSDDGDEALSALMASPSDGTGGVQFNSSLSASPHNAADEDSLPLSPYLGPEDMWPDFDVPDLPDAQPAQPAPRHEDPDWERFLMNYDNDSGVEEVYPINARVVAKRRHDHQTPVGQAFHPAAPMLPVGSTKEECVQEVVDVFPNICLDYVMELYDSGIGQVAETLLRHILDKQDQGIEYPKASDKLKSLKRKRNVDEDDEAAKVFANIDREAHGQDYGSLTRNILSNEFPFTPMSFIESTLSDTRRHLYPAYMILEEANRTYNPLTSPYIRIKKPRATIIPWSPERVEETLQSERSTADTMLVLKELKAARRATLIAGEKRLVEVRQQMEEEENVRRAKVEGTLLECGCCYEDFPMNRMVHCQNEQTIHWFCRPCTRQTAENEIGNSKYQIKCMSMEGCESGFSRATKMQFLDEKTLIALDRNEQEEMLRLAGIENLASCPFCPFAAEYPPVEENREFRCQAPDCEKISCRLCQEESHIPKSCAEHAKDKGLSVRRQIEEAMSAALIRKCNKCGTPFIKEEGCNKMTCTRSGCYNIQCYVCSKSCSYDHFNDRSRGGKPGNCPLFENVEERHQQEVSKAEKEALALVRQEHPEYTEEDLKIKVSEEVKKDEERKRSMPPRHPIHGPFAHRMPPGMPVPARVRAAGVANDPAILVQAEAPPPYQLHAPAAGHAWDRYMPAYNVPIDPLLAFGADGVANPAAQAPAVGAAGRPARLPVPPAGPAQLAEPGLRAPFADPFGAFPNDFNNIIGFGPPDQNYLQRAYGGDLNLFDNLLVQDMARPRRVGFNPPPSPQGQMGRFPHLAVLNQRRQQLQLQRQRMQGPRGNIPAPVLNQVAAPGVVLARPRPNP